ncbi:transcriptional regulator family: Fungal Specific TF [Penicillium roqueforti]|nr:transcriptional regulator family: Fungal Specific TF [Penicillium roqueforti]
MSGFLDSIKQDSSSSSYSLFGPKQYSESVAFWHDPSAAPTMVVPPSHTTSHKQLSDQKKHKRTRSGCFTCRSRRVKCDENRPVCERCRKGNRDCVYPSPTASSSASSVPSKPSSRSTAKSRASRPHSHGSDSSSKVDSESLSPLHPIIDEEEPDSSVSESRPSPASATTTSQPDLRKSQSAQSLRKHGARPASDTSSYIKEQSSSPSTGSPRFESVSVRSGSLGHSTTELLNNARLPDDLRFYLNFHQDFMTPPHFFLRHNSSYFIHHSLIELALQYEPLLYALVGFSAYHYSLHSPGGKLYTFLKYYNKALTLLRKSLSSGEEHSEATLCTVLVLTTFEEFIGDWMNMIDHHQAAHAFMRKLITPESANMNELHTNIFLWYARFDVVVGILSGTETVLGRDWYLAKEQHDAEQAAFYPDDPSKQLALVASINRRFGLDMASLYAKLSRGMLSMEQFAIQNDQLGQWLEQAKTILRGFDDYEYKIQHYPQKQPLTEDDVIDPYVPGVLYRGPLWDFNYAWIDILATETMYKFQTMQVLQQPLLEDLQTLAKEQCRIIETMIRWPHKENGYCINFKNSLGMLGMFLPTEHQHKYQMWARRTLALLEQHGYIIVPSFRAGLAAIWQVPEVNYWWLPNDEGYTSIVREIRSLTDERSTQPRDEKRETVRDMKSLFGKLNLDETDDDKSPP